jgi:Spy/CpxP family protein refolding chaperone
MRADAAWRACPARDFGAILGANPCAWPPLRFFTNRGLGPKHWPPIVERQKEPTMIGLALGLGVLGFFIAHRARRHALAHGGGCGRWGGWNHHHHGGWYGYGGYGGGRGDGWLRFVSARLDTTPAQERVIQREVTGLVETARDARRNAFSGKADLARAIGSPVFDADAATAGFAGVTKAVDDLRARAVEALRNIHAVLDDEQRKQLAELVDSGHWRFAGRGPYR